MVGDTVEFTTHDFREGAAAWPVQFIDAMWEVLPDHRTHYLNIYNGFTGSSHPDKAAADRVGRGGGAIEYDRLSCVELTVDLQGQVLTCRNV
jgi:hypothetical protein